MLEDLLEQEKRELQRQHLQNSSAGVSGPSGIVNAGPGSGPNGPEKAFLSDTDFEKLKADVLAGEGVTSVSLSPIAAVPHQHQHQQPQVHVQQQQQVHHVQQQQFQHPQFPQQRQAGFPVQQQQQQFPQRVVQQQQWPVQQQPQRSPDLHPALLQSQSNLVTARPPLPPPMLPAMTAPPESTSPNGVLTEAERQVQFNYEQWLMQQQNLVCLF